MTLVAWVVLGFAAGLAARWLLPGREPGGCLAILSSVATGVAGALFGGWLSTALGFGGLAAALDWRNLVIAFLGSALLLLLLRLGGTPRGGR